MLGLIREEKQESRMETAKLELNNLLTELVNRGGSDLYITTDSPPLIRAEGLAQPVGS